MMMSAPVYTDTLARLLRDSIGELPPQTMPLVEASGRYLAGDVVTKHPSPRFDNAQMDGYGIGYANVAGGRFRVGPDIPAGKDPAEIYHYGINGYGHDTAVPIMTGAQIPDDVVAIIPVEQAQPPRFVESGEYVHLPAVEVGKFIRKTGSDMPAGTTLAPAGTRIDTALIAAAAAQGFAEFTVQARPTIAMIAGGDEVVTGKHPVTAKIFDANTPLAQALAQTHGMEIVATGTTTDDFRQFRSEIDRILDDSSPHIILTSGGISEGKYEVVRQLLERLELSWVGKIPVQPGGPQGYGVYRGTPIIALPGNPISTLVAMRMLVVPALWKAFGSGWAPETVQAMINEPVTGIEGKTQYRRAIVGTHRSQLVAQLQGAAGSHLVSQAVGANAVIEIPPSASFKAGHTVTAHLFADATLNTSLQPVANKQHTVAETPRSLSDPEGKTAQVVIASTRAAAGVYSDDVGPEIVQWLRSKGYVTPQSIVVSDQQFASTVKKILTANNEPRPDVLITSGGTGISPTDHTVEAITPLLDVQMPHIMTAILIRGLKNTPHAALTRGVAGLSHQTFVVTLPGSPGGVKDGTAVLDEILDHIVEQIRGTDHKRGES